MPDQLPLAGFAAESKPTDRLFFGLMAEATVVPRITRIAQQLRADHRLTGRIIRPERFHVTLRLLGDYHGLPEGIAQTALAAAATVAALPFGVRFDHAASFAGKPGHHPLVLRGHRGLDELQAFRQTLGGALQKAGLGQAGGEKFTPHVTLLYDAQRLPEVPVEPVGWTVNEFVLVHSLLGQGRYLVLGRWPLRG